MRVSVCSGGVRPPLRLRNHTQAMGPMASTTPTDIRRARDDRS